MHLQDYVCHVAKSIDPPRQLIPTAYSGTVFPVEDFLSYNRLSSPHKAFVASIDANVEPKSYSQAIRDPR